MELAALHQEIIDAISQGDFVGPIDKFYADDVLAYTNDAPPAKGREAISAAESKYVEGVTAFHGVEVFATAVDDQGDGNGTVFYETRMRWAHQDRPEVDVRQAVVERWSGGKISEIRFYGDIEM